MAMLENFVLLQKKIKSAKLPTTYLIWVYLCFNMNLKKRILVAPLNWGLGHATRCIPIINALINHNFEVIIASDGKALELLKKEFYKIETVELPSYNIKYPEKGQSLKLKLFQDSPKFLKAYKSEKKTTKKIIENYNIDGIISDNRFGVYHKTIPSAFITHQLQVLSGNTTWLSTKLHQNVIKKFTECWIPDYLSEPNLSGKLSHTNNFNSIPLKYIGPQSRFTKHKSEQTYDIMVLLSGPEPQRTHLEEKLLYELKTYKGKILFIKGIVESTQIKSQVENMIIYNYMTSKQLEKAINESKLVLSRSGYTSIMDLARLEKKAFFIPTPGQFEQEYLAEKLETDGLVPFCKQNDFTVNQLKKVANYKGFKDFENDINYKKLFSLFERK